MNLLQSLGLISGIVNTGASLYGTYKGVKQGEASTELAQQQLEFAKHQEDEKREIYGDLEKNLAKFYTDMTPEKRATLGLDRYDEQFKLAKDNLDQRLAQRGLSNSGIAAQADYQLQQQAIRDRLALIQENEKQAQAERLGFLGLGLGQQNVAAQSVANAGRTAIANLQTQQNNWSQFANQTSNSAGDVFGALLYDKGRREAKGNVFTNPANIF